MSQRLFIPMTISDEPYQIFIGGCQQYHRLMTSSIDDTVAQGLRHAGVGGTGDIFSQPTISKALISRQKARGIRRSVAI